MLIDSHCHLSHLKEKTVDQIIQEAESYNVKHMLSICVEKGDIEPLSSLVDKHPMIKATLGIHPCDVHNHQLSDLMDITTLFKKNPDKFIGVGETGLDFYYSKEYESKQKNFFENQLNIANELGYPTVIHSRSAPKETVDMLKQTPCEKAIIHCFTESLDMAKACLDLGAYISFSGIITFKNAESIRDVVRYVPLDRMLVETDSPYLAPVPHRGHENQPAYVHYVAKKVAEIKRETLETVAEQTTRNFKRLFGWPQEA